MFSVRNLNALQKGVGFFTAVGLAVLVSVSAANAFSLVFGANSISSNSPLTGAAGTVVFTFTDEVGDVRVTLNISNTTGDVIFGDGATSSKLTGFGFDLLSGATFKAGSFNGSASIDSVILGASFSPFGTLDFAVADNDNFNGGNANDALPQGETTSVNFLLDAVANAASLETLFQAAFFDDGLQAAMRFQQVEGGQNDGASDKLVFVPPGPVDNIPPVPVPAALPLFGTGLAIMGFIGWRRKRKL